MKIRKWVKQNGYSIILLVILLGVFTTASQSYWNVSFTGNNAMKYQAYVEPSINMHETGDPLHYEHFYKVYPTVENPGVSYVFPRVPLMSWGLASTFGLFSDNSYEYNIRIFMNFIGMVSKST